MTPPPVVETPAEFLRWTDEGNHHVHSEEEARAGAWRKFATCDTCPWRLPWAEAEEVPKGTQVIRRKEGT